MKRFLQITVLMALMMVLMGTTLYAQTLNIPVQIERRCSCGYGGTANDAFLVKVYYRVNGTDLHSHDVVITNGSDNVPYSVSIANALNATGVKIVVIPLNGHGTPQQGLQTIGQAQPMKFTFSLIPVPPFLTHTCK